MDTRRSPMQVPLPGPSRWSPPSSGARSFVREGDVDCACAEDLAGLAVDRRYRAQAR